MLSCKKGAAATQTWRPRILKYLPHTLCPRKVTDPELMRGQTEISMGEGVRTVRKGGKPLNYPECSAHCKRYSVFEPNTHAINTHMCFYLCGISSYSKHNFRTTTYSYWAVTNPKRWCCESAALNMTANLGNSAVGTGLQKVSFHFNPKGSQSQRMLFQTIAQLHPSVSYACNAQNSPS